MPCSGSYPTVLCAILCIPPSCSALLDLACQCWKRQSRSVDFSSQETLIFDFHHTSLSFALLHSPHFLNLQCQRRKCLLRSFDGLTKVELDVELRLAFFLVLVQVPCVKCGFDITKVLVDLLRRQQLPVVNRLVDAVDGLVDHIAEDSLLCRRNMTSHMSFTLLVTTLACEIR